MNEWIVFYFFFLVLFRFIRLMDFIIFIVNFAINYYAGRGTHSVYEMRRQRSARVVCRWRQMYRIFTCCRSLSTTRSQNKNGCHCALRFFLFPSIENEILQLKSFCIINDIWMTFSPIWRDDDVLFLEWAEVRPGNRSQSTCVDLIWTA